MNFSSTHILQFFSSLLPCIIIFIAGLLVPYFQKSSVCFGIPISVQFKAKYKLKKFNILYKKLYFKTSGLFLLLSSILIFNNTHSLLLMILLFLSLLNIMAFDFCTIHKKVKKLKSKFDWSSGNKNLIFKNQSDSINTLSYSKILWPSIFILIINILIFIVKFNKVPNLTPVHYNYDNSVDIWMKKSYLSYILIYFSQVWLIIFTYYLALTIKESEKISLLIYDNINNRLNKSYNILYIILKFNLFIINILFFIINLSLLTIISSKYVLNSCIATLISLLILNIILQIILNINKSKLSKKSNENSTSLDKTTLDYWILGFIYFNPTSKALWSSKRIGFGYTLNSSKFISKLFFIIVMFFIIFTLVILSQIPNI